MLPFHLHDLKSAQISRALPQPLASRSERWQAAQPRCGRGQYPAAPLAGPAPQLGAKFMIARRALLVAVAQAPLAVAMAVQSSRPAAAEPVEAPPGDE